MPSQEQTGARPPDPQRRVRFSREAIDKSDELQATTVAVERNLRNQASKLHTLRGLQLQHALLQRLNEPDNTVLVQSLEQFNQKEVEQLNRIARREKELTQEIRKYEASIEILRRHVSPRLLNLVDGYVKDSGNRRMLIVYMDLMSYSDRSSELHGNVGAPAVTTLDKQIQSFVTSALEKLSFARSEVVLQTAGDSAILTFDLPEDAHDFMVLVHQFTIDHNSTAGQFAARRWFRSGIATGEMDLRPRGGGDYEFSGYTVAIAARLQAAAEPGQIVIDAETFADLPRVLQSHYVGPEEVQGKRTEHFAAYRYTVAPPPPDKG